MVTALIVFYILRQRYALSKLQVEPLYSKLYTGAIALVIESALPLSVVGMVFATIYSLPIPSDPSSVAPLLTTQLVLSFFFYALCVSQHPSSPLMRISLTRFCVPVACPSCYHLPRYYRSILGEEGPEE